MWGPRGGVWRIGVLSVESRGVAAGMVGWREGREEDSHDGRTQRISVSINRFSFSVKKLAQ